MIKSMSTERTYLTNQVTVLDPGEITLLHCVDSIDDVLFWKFADNFFIIIPYI